MDRATLLVAHLLILYRWLHSHVLHRGAPLVVAPNANLPRAIGVILFTLQTVPTFPSPLHTGLAVSITE